MKKLFRLFLRGVGVMTLCFIAATVLGSFVDDEQVIPAPTVEKVEVAEPTLEPAILVPTEEPSPVPFEDDADEVEYIEFMFYAGEVYVEALDGLSALMGEASVDPSHLSDKAWNMEMTGWFLVIQILDEEILSYSPVPKRFAFVHAFMINAALEYELMGEKLAQGIFDMDADLIEEASGHIENATYAIQEATAALEKLLD